MHLPKPSLNNSCAEDETELLNKELDMTLKTTDSGHGGSSVGSHSPSHPTSLENGGQNPGGQFPTDPNLGSKRGHTEGSSGIRRTPIRFNPEGRGLRSPVQMPPNSGPPPRHLLPAKLRPSPGVKLHPPGVILDFKGKTFCWCQIFPSSVQ